MARDLTTGSPMRLIWSFALPTLFGMLFQQFYNMMDTMIVGQLLGASALASVGSTSSINFFVIGFCMGGVQRASPFLWPSAWEPEITARCAAVWPTPGGCPPCSPWC